MGVSVRGVRVSSQPDSSYFLRVDWSGRGLASGFQLLLTDGQNAWRGDGNLMTSQVTWYLLIYAHLLDHTHRHTHTHTHTDTHTHTHTHTSHM